MSKENDSEYPVSYKKPPRHTQFKPGKSGNPHGRPKKTSTFDEAFRRESLAPVTLIQEGGKRQKISKQDAMLRQLMDSAANGDLRAATLVIKLSQHLKNNERSGLEKLIDTFRARHDQIEADEQRRTRTASDGDSNPPKSGQKFNSKEEGS